MKTSKQLLKSFALEGKITERHSEQIEEILTEALKERDELLEEAQWQILYFVNNHSYDPREIKWLSEYKKLLDKDK